MISLLSGLLFCLLVVFSTGCGTSVRKQDMAKGYPESALPAPAGQPVFMAPVTEAFEYKKSTATYRAEPNFLGKLMYEVIGLGPVPMIPLTMRWYKYESDLPRTEALREAFSARLKARGIPMADVSDPSALKPGQYAMTARLRGMDVTGKYSFITLIIDSGMTLKQVLVAASIDCALWAGGKTEPVWSGTIEAKNTEGGSVSAKNVFAKAFAVAADRCIEKSGLAAMRAVSLEKSFAQMIDQGRYAEAYAVANSLEQTLAAVKGLARTASGREVPEEARDLMAKGKAAAALAKSPKDFETASTAMENALLLAPWWASGHYNAALAEEGAGRWLQGAKHMRLYLTLKPDAEDREAVRMKIAEFELHQERGDKAAGVQ